MRCSLLARLSVRWRQHERTLVAAGAEQNQDKQGEQDSGAGFHGREYNRGLRPNRPRVASPASRLQFLIA